MGWSILGGAGVVIAGIFLVSHQLGTRSTTPAAAVAAVPSASAQPAPASGTPAVPSANSAPPSNSTETPPSPPAVAVVEPDNLDQPSRKAFLLKLIRQGVFTGIQALDSPPKVGVTPVFEGLSLELKQQFIATVSSYINNGAPSTVAVQLIDATTGQLVGSYTSAGGLKLL